MVRPETTSELRIGSGSAIGHHGEILQGAVTHPVYGLRHFLVTLPYPEISAQAQFQAIKHQALSVTPAWKTKSYLAAKHTLLYLGLHDYGGELQIHSNTLPELGYGSSTSDVVATIRAVAQAFSHNLTPPEISAIAISAEQACDPLMYSGQCLAYCQREGLILRHFLQPLPPMFVVGFNPHTDSGGVATLDLPVPDYTPTEIDSYHTLLDQLYQALCIQSVAALGAVATASACLNQRFLPKPQFAALLEILAACGACGLQVAHSGGIAGFLFDPKLADPASQYAYVQAELARLGIHRSWCFTAPNKAGTGQTHLNL